MSTFQRGNNKAKKLTGEEVVRIREMYLTGQWTYGALSNAFNVSKNSIENVVKGYTWKNMAGHELIGVERMPPERQFAGEELMQKEIEASKARMQAKLETQPLERQPPAAGVSWYDQPPLELPGQEPTGIGMARLQKEIDELPVSKLGNELEKLKGD